MIEGQFPGLGHVPALAEYPAVGVDGAGHTDAGGHLVGLRVFEFGRDVVGAEDVVPPAHDVVGVRDAAGVEEAGGGQFELGVVGLRHVALSLVVAAHALQDVILVYCACVVLST